jgi:hypothetical protein
MSQPKFYSPLKIGLLIVSLSYFLFTFHAMFTLSWIGEWEPLGGSWGFIIFVEDISATIGLIFRFAASVLAFAGVIYYFAKKNMEQRTAYKVLRWGLVFEGIYWLGLIATAFYTILGVGFMLSGGPTTLEILNYVFLSIIPTVVEAVVLPVAIFILVYKLSPNKPLKGAIKWALISGTIMIAVFWLTNTSMWVGVVDQKGIDYLLAYPENLVSFFVTAIGMAALTIYTAYLAKKTSGTPTLLKLPVRTIGAIILALGMFFLWNYSSWVVFAGDTWNNWYAWFLGHNMDLWLLSLPLVGLPLLLTKEAS